ncbi:MAG: type II secretion system protein [Chthoniobacterales bacterium]
MNRNNTDAFTLIELLVVIGILAILITLSVPGYTRLVDRARSTTCGSNLKHIGESVLRYASEHDNAYPIIEANPGNPIYPEDVEAKGLLETLEPYGLSKQALICPADLAGPKHFDTYGLSYEWCPIADDEKAVAPMIYSRRRGAVAVSPKRLSIVMDFGNVHSGRRNRLYADGHIRKY